MTSRGECDGCVYWRDWPPSTWRGLASMWCQWCHDYISLGPSSDSIPVEELWLAESIQEAHVLWEPGRDRTENIAKCIQTACEWLEPKRGKR